MNYPARVLVAGATRGVGARAVERLRQLGVAARAFARSARGEDAFSGDALSPGDCARAMEGCDAVVCALGDRWPPKDRPIVDGAGVINLAEAAAAAGARRFVLVSSLGVGPTWPLLPLPLRWFFQGLGLRPILQEKERSEARLKALPLEWTILYPALLHDLGMRGEPLVVRDGLAGGTSSRQGVADVAARCLVSANAGRASLVVVDGCMRVTMRGEGPFHLERSWEPW